MSMTTAPPLDCVACARTIGNRRTHYVVDQYRVLCAGCIHRRELHTELWPTCPHGWHDGIDHLVIACRRRRRTRYPTCRRCDATKGTR